MRDVVFNNVIHRITLYRLTACLLLLLYGSMQVLYVLPHQDSTAQQVSEQTEVEVVDTTDDADSKTEYTTQSRYMLHQSNKPRAAVYNKCHSYIQEPALQQHTPPPRKA